MFSFAWNLGREKLKCLSFQNISEFKIYDFINVNKVNHLLPGNQVRIHIFWKEFSLIFADFNVFFNFLAKGLNAPILNRKCELSYAKYDILHNWMD